jgi:hypothetical protein
MSFRPFNPFVPPPPDRPRNSRVDSNGRPIDPQKEQRPIADPRKLSLIGLLSYAASNLQFTREGMPRVLMFGAFIASLIAVVLSMLLFTVHLLGGTN